MMWTRWRFFFHFFRNLGYELSEWTLKCRFRKLVPQNPPDLQKNAIFFHLGKILYLQEFLELETHIFRFLGLTLKRSKIHSFLLIFKIGTPPLSQPKARKMFVFPVDIYIRNWSIPYINVNSEKSHLTTFGYERGGVPIFKTKKKECIFERFSMWTKKYENMSF